MSRIFLKHLCLLLLTAMSVTACSLKKDAIFFSPHGPEIMSPPPTSTEPFPSELARYCDYTHWLSQECRNGRLVGQSIHKSDYFLSALLDSWLSKYVTHLLPPVPAPDGNGKIYKLYQKWETDIGDFVGTTRVVYGYSFSYYTTDAGIITECRVTRTILTRHRMAPTK